MQDVTLSPGSDNRYSMNDEISWDPGRMEFKPVEMMVTHEEGMRFVATSQAGTTIPIDAHVHLGGGGRIPNPIEYLVASLGGCIGIKILLSLSDHGITPDRLTIGILANRRQTLPAVFSQVHLTVTLAGAMDDDMVHHILEKTMTHLCPIAAMFAELGEITFDHQVIRN